MGAHGTCNLIDIIYRLGSQSIRKGSATERADLRGCEPSALIS